MKRVLKNAINSENGNVAELNALLNTELTAEQIVSVAIKLKLSFPPSFLTPMEIVIPDAPSCCESMLTEGIGEGLNDFGDRPLSLEQPSLGTGTTAPSSDIQSAQSSTELSISAANDKSGAEVALAASLAVVTTSSAGAASTKESVSFSSGESEKATEDDAADKESAEFLLSHTDPTAPSSVLSPSYKPSCDETSLLVR